jgi:hypothetical protein
VVARRRVDGGGRHAPTTATPTVHVLLQVVQILEQNLRENEKIAISGYIDKKDNLKST